MPLSQKTIRQFGLALGVLGLLGSSAHAAMETGPFNKPLEISVVGQKGPAPGISNPRTDQLGDAFATVPGSNSGGLVFANLSDLRLLVAEIGSARLERDDDGDQYIVANVNGINYAVDVYNCEPDCADLTFTASFEVDGISDTLMNEWNATRRFGKAYIREDGDAVIQFAINTRYGISVETFRDDMEWWKTVLDDYVEFIGFR